MRVFLFVAAAIAVASPVSAQTVPVDSAGTNTGTLQNALQFGKPQTRVFSNPKSGPRTVTLPPQVGIASNQSTTPAGGNTFGLDLFTGGGPQVSITSSGLVGIGIRQPLSQLHLYRPGDVEIGLQSADTGGRFWSMKSAGVQAGNSASSTFQIFDRTAGQARLQIDAAGTVSVKVLQITGGADLAEPFAVSDAGMEAGSVLIIDEENPGRLTLSETPYDHRVAGVLSGAGGVGPAVTMTQFASPANSQASDVNVALSGRVYVLADAGQGAIHPGDLLTTSSTPGHCMKAVDYNQARGAILGKAMSSLDSGKGLVLALVTLQ